MGCLMALDRHSFSIISMSHIVIAYKPPILFALFWQLYNASICLCQDEVQLVSFGSPRTLDTGSNYA